MMAGLSDKYVAIAPIILAPGNPYNGLTKIDNNLLIKAITPNSDNNALKAPAKTASAIIKNTVFNK